MCGHIGQGQVKVSEGYKELLPEASKVVLGMNPIQKNHRVLLGSSASILIKENLAFKSQQAQFAYFAAHNKKGDKRYVFNVRAENFLNKENDINYNGKYGIFQNPFLEENQLINNRCIVPCNFFIEQPDNSKIKRKFLFKRKDESSIFLGGTYVRHENGDIGFALITTPGIPTVKDVASHSRSPVIIGLERIHEYLDQGLSEFDLTTFFQPDIIQEYIGYEVMSDISKKVIPLEDTDDRMLQSIGLF